MELRKRPHSDEDEPPVLKKRVLQDSKGSPHVNGTHVEQDEPGERDNLELFRKGAIYRRMRFYSRENDRSLGRIAELERRNRTCEAGLAAISACRTQLVDAIRLLVKAEQLPRVDANAQAILDLTAYIRDDTASDLPNILGEHMVATQELITKFVQLSGDPQSVSLQGDAYMECQKAKTESISLRSQVDILQSRLQESEAQKEKYHKALQAAETQVDRLKSSTVQALQPRVRTEKTEPKTEVIEESKELPSPAPAQPSPSSPVQPPQINGTHDPLEAEILQDQLGSREAKIAELEQESAILRDQVTLLEVAVKCAPHEQLLKNPLYVALREHAARLQATFNQQRTKISSLTEELESLQASKKEWEDSITGAANQAAQEYKSMLAKRDSESARLRDQRDQLTAELNERKQQDSVKLASHEELAALSESRAERVHILESEIQRLKMQLAANVGNKDLMTFFSEGGTDQADYIENLKERVTAAETRASALEQSLSIFQDDNPNVVAHMRAEADALQRLGEATSELERYRSVYGTSLSPDIATLTTELKNKDDEIQRLRLLDQQREQSESSLYGEIDKLSAAWESLDRQVKSKILDLSGMEDRLSKSVLDRAKSENKYYAAMRDKEAIESERKNLVRHNEKQAKYIERLVETTVNLPAQLGDMEKETKALRKACDMIKARNDEVEKELSELRARSETERIRSSELVKVVHERERNLDQKRAELRKVEDGLNKSKKSLERQASKLKELASGTGHHKESDSAEGYIEHLLSLLKCSTCKLNFRNTVITKCMHTFCKQCLDTRISTRQRKCPACNNPFAQTDMQSMFFQ